MAVDENILIQINDKDRLDANFFACKFANKAIRDRAFINALGAKLAIKYFEENGINIEGIYNLHYVRKILEEFDIADIMFPNIHVDVRVVYNESQIFIPKSHFEYDILPDIYLVMKMAPNFSHVDLLGFFEPNLINKNNQNNDYYFIERVKLSPICDLKNYIQNYTGNTMLNLSEDEIENTHIMMFDMLDNDITDEDKKKLCSLLLQSGKLRDDFIELENFETLSYGAVNNPAIDFDENRKNGNEVDLSNFVEEETEKPSQEDSLLKFNDESETESKEDNIAPAEFQEYKEDTISAQDENDLNKYEDIPLEELGDLDSLVLGDIANADANEGVNLDDSNLPKDTQDKKGSDILGGIANIAGAAAGGAIVGGMASGAVEASQIASNIAGAASGASNAASAAINEADDLLSSLDDFLSDNNSKPENNISDEKQNDFSDTDTQVSNNDLTKNADDKVSDVNLSDVDLSDLNLDENSLENLDLDNVEDATNKESNADETLTSDEDTAEDSISTDSKAGEIDKLYEENNYDESDEESGIVTDNNAPATEELPVADNSVAADLTDNITDDSNVVSFDEITDKSSDLNFDTDSIKVENLEEPKLDINDEENDISFDELNTDEQSSGFGKNLMTSLTNDEENNVNIQPLNHNTIDVNGGDLQGISDINVADDADTTQSASVPEVSSDDLLDEIDGLLNNNDETSAEESQVVEKGEVSENDTEQSIANDLNNDEVLSQEISNNTDNQTESSETNNENTEEQQSVQDVTNEDDDKILGELLSENSEESTAQPDAISEADNIIAENTDANIGADAALTADSTLVKAEEAQENMTEDIENSVDNNSENPTDNQETSSETQESSTTDEESPTTVENPQNLGVLFDGKPSEEAAMQSVAEDGDTSKLPGMALKGEENSKNTTKMIVVGSVVALIAVAGIAYGVKASKASKTASTNAGQEVPAPISGDAQQGVPASADNGNQDISTNIPDVSASANGTSSSQTQTASNPAVIVPANSTKSKSQNAGSDAYLSVKNLVWQVPDYLSYSDTMKTYLKSAGKSIKLSLSSDLLLATEYAYSNRVKIALKVTNTGSVQDAKIVSSSGSNQIDNIVLQSVKNTLNAVKPPAEVIKTPEFNLTITIYF